MLNYDNIVLSAVLLFSSTYLLPGSTECLNLGQMAEETHRAPMSTAQLGGFQSKKQFMGREQSRQLGMPTGAKYGSEQFF